MADSTLSSSTLPWPDEPGLASTVHALAVEAEPWLQRGDYRRLAERLAALPLPAADAQPGLLRLRGHLLWRSGDPAGAIAALEQARQLAARQQAWPLAAYCALDIAAWHHQQAELGLARAYCDSAQNYARHVDIDPALEAHLALAIGRLCPDLGLHEQAITWASRGLELYERLGDVAGQADALCCLATAKMSLAYLLEARGYVARALRLHQVAGLGAARYLELLCLRARLALYEGQVDAGLMAVQRAASERETRVGSQEALHLLLAEAALLRQAGNLAQALQLLAEAQQALEESASHGLLPWLALERSWTQVLAGAKPAEARGALLKAASLQDVAMQRSLALHFAVLDLLEARWSDAAARLEAVLQQFQASGELLEIFAVQLYVAYVRLRVGQRSAARLELEAALGWAEAAGCDGFALCWHPEIVAEVCVEALRMGVRPRQAEVMIVRRLGDVAVPGLLRLLEAPEQQARQRARSVLGALGVERTLEALEGLPNVMVRRALREHLAEGRLAASRLDALRSCLGATGNCVGWQRLAVFGYYAGGELGRLEIADRLAMSVGAVKREIAAIRAAFGVESAGGRDPGREHVRQRALADGFVLRRSGLR